MKTNPPRVDTLGVRNAHELYEEINGDGPRLRPLYASVAAYMRRCAIPELTKLTVEQFMTRANVYDALRCGVGEASLYEKDVRRCIRMRVPGVRYTPHQQWLREQVEFLYERCREMGDGSGKWLFDTIDELVDYPIREYSYLSRSWSSSPYTLKASDVPGTQDDARLLRKIYIEEAESNDEFELWIARRHDNRWREASQDESLAADHVITAHIGSMIEAFSIHAPEE